MRTRLQDGLRWQAERRPGARAAVLEKQVTTYGALEEGSNRLARALHAAGCSRGDRVALLLPKSPQTLIAMFAALKADCMYVPLDTSSPSPRIARILELCECRCLLAMQSTSGLLNEIIKSAGLAPGTRIGWMDGGANLPGGIRAQFTWDDVQALSCSAVDSRNDENDPAHILFTSGSTGTPKGVVITHSNVIHFVRWAVRYFGMDAGDRLSGHSPLHFDLSTFDIYGSVAAGAELHLIPRESSILPHRLATFIRESELTQWFSIPSILQQMAKLDVVRQNDFPSLRRLLWCGERFPTPALIHWMQRLPRVRFFNLYGPTEATIASSCYSVPKPPEDEKAEIPIGEPCEAEQLLVLDNQLQPTAIGEIGNLYIAGVGLSPGYWKDPERTKDVFFSNPYSSNPSDRIYRTGDLARIGNDGSIYLVGRSDSQVKSRGYRIELGEIETAIYAVPGIQDAAVMALDVKGFEGTTICCAYVPSPGSPVSPLFLRRHLAQVLPPYMLPASWMVLDNMPRTGSGKTDWSWLRKQFRQQLAPRRLAAVGSVGEQSGNR